MMMDNIKTGTVTTFAMPYLTFTEKGNVSLFFYESTAPMPTPQASHSISNTFSKFRKAKMGVLVSFFLMSTKALSTSSVQTKGPFFFKQSIIGATKVLKL